MERTSELESKVRKQIYEYFADQCGIDIERLSDNTDIIEEINGDSLMFLQLLEKWKREYQLDVEFRLVGKYVARNPANTLGKAIELALVIICEGEQFREKADS